MLENILTKLQFGKIDFSYQISTGDSGYEPYRPTKEDKLVNKKRTKLNMLLNKAHKLQASLLETKDEIKKLKDELAIIDPRKEQ